MTQHGFVVGKGTPKKELLSKVEEIANLGIYGVKAVHAIEGPYSIIAYYVGGNPAKKIEEAFAKLGFHSIETWGGLDKVPHASK